MTTKQKIALMVLVPLADQYFEAKYLKKWIIEWAIANLDNNVVMAVFREKLK